MYGFIVTRDHIACGKSSAVGTRGPIDVSDAILDHLNAGGGSCFRLRDDDGEVYFEGRVLVASSADLFAPLDDFGAAHGCTDIQYKVGGRWGTL